MGSAQELMKETNLTAVNVKADKIKEGKEYTKLTECNSLNLTADKIKEGKENTKLTESNSLNLTAVNVKAEKIKEGKENTKLMESNSVKANILIGEKEEINSRKSAVEYPPTPALNHKVSETRRANTRTIENESNDRKCISDNKQMAEANKSKQASNDTNSKSDTKKEIIIQRRENPSKITETFDKEMTKNMKVKRRESSIYEDLKKSDVKGGLRDSDAKKDDLPPNVILWVLVLTAALVGFW